MNKWVWVYFFTLFSKYIQIIFKSKPHAAIMASTPPYLNLSIPAVCPSTHYFKQITHLFSSLLLFVSSIFVHTHQILVPLFG